MKFSLLKNSNNESSKLKNEKTNNSNILENDSPNENNSILNHEIKYDNKMFISKKYDYPILDKDIMEFVARNFPESSDIISKSLIDLKNTIETSIDIIEETSSKIIKDERNFSLSAKYRDTSISLYKISNNIKSYINWMDTLNKDNIEPKIEGDISNDDTTTFSNSNTHKNEFTIFSDFTDTQPKGFIIDYMEVVVDDWNDLVIKTADALIKIYRSSKKSSYTEIKIPELSSKKSPENEFRDTIIEMLVEYKIEPSRYKVIVY